MKELPLLGHGIGLTFDQALVACKKRLEGDDIYSKLDFINLGFFHDEPIPGELPALLKEASLPVTLHTIDINLSGTINEKQILETEKKIKALNIHWLVEDLGIWVWEDTYLGAHQLNPIQDEETLEQTVKNVSRVKELLGVQVLVENAPAYCIQGNINIWDYLERIVEGSACGIALDIGHMIGLLMNSDQEIRFPSENWPGWKSVYEIHLSGFEILDIRGKRFCLDMHSLTFNKLLLLKAEEVVEKAMYLRSVLLELEFATEEIVKVNLESSAFLVERLKLSKQRF